MGCLKLTYQTSESPLKVVYRANGEFEKPVQRFISVDPLAHEFASWSPYAFCNDNPLRFVDPDGRAAQDWVRKDYTDKDGNKKGKWQWKSEIKSEEQAKAAGYDAYSDGITNNTYKGSIDGKPITAWLGPGGENDHGFSYDNPETPEAGISPFLWAQVSSVGPSGPITNPGAGLFMLGNNSEDFAELRSAWGSSQGWQQFNGYMNNFAWNASLFAGGEAFMGFVPSGGLHSNVVRTGSNSSTRTAINGFTQHGTNQAITRGFDTRSILTIVREGNVVEKMGRYGAQTRYTLGNNTVVLNSSNKIVTVFSNASGTANGLGSGLFIPF